MSDLVEFLNKRIDEDEWFAKSLTQWSWSYRPRWLTDNIGTVLRRPVQPSLSRDRLLAEVAAKRAIVRNCELAGYAVEDQPLSERLKASDGPVAAYWRGQNWTLQQLAAVYRDHPDFRAEWAASGDGLVLG